MTAFSQVSSQIFSESSAIPSFAQALERLLNPYESISLRVPFYMYSTWREYLNQPGVKMMMNPTAVSFTQKKRITRRDTQEGSTIFHWTNHLGYNNDILEVQFKGMTGNINLNQGAYRNNSFTDKMAGYINKGTDWLNDKLGEASGALDSSMGIESYGVNKNLSGASKLSAFINLFQVTREPVLNPETGDPIYYYIQYASTAFGNTFITLVGYFSNPLEFTDDANSRFNHNYSFSFTALSTIPDMNYIYNYVLANLGKDFMNDLVPSEGGITDI